MRRRREPLKKTDAWRAWKAEVEKQLTLHGWTAKDLAEMAGYSYSHVSNAMNGGIAARVMLEKVSAVLGIEPPKE